MFAKFHVPHTLLELLFPAVVHVVVCLAFFHGGAWWWARV